MDLILTITDFRGILSKLGSSLITEWLNHFKCSIYFPFYILGIFLTGFLAAIIGVRLNNLSNLSLLFHFLLGPSGGFELQDSFINFHKFCKNYNGFSLVYNSLSGA